MKTRSGQEILPGFNVRDISADYGETKFDVLFVSENGNSGYSNDVFDSKEEAVKYAESCNAKTPQDEGWGCYLHSEFSNYWILIKHIEANAA